MKLAIGAFLSVLFKDIKYALKVMIIYKELDICNLDNSRLRKEEKEL